MMIAKDFNEFIDKVSQAERKVLNTEAGQALTQELLKMKLADNPNMTPEEWQQTKSEFMTFIFYQFVKDCPEAMSELEDHVYNELKKEG